MTPPDRIRNAGAVRSGAEVRTALRKLGIFGSGALNHRRDLFVVRMARE
jgi:hypothetical protein